MTVPEISVRDIQRTASVNIRDLQKFAERAMRLCIKIPHKKRTELMRLREIFVFLISDRRIARLHRQFLGQTSPTDVLTFQHGEIFISVEMAERQARMFGNSLTRELQLYIVHGLLHLHGFDDRTRSGARRMKKAQEKILSQVLSC
jgi:probable rRNA maturation factor